MRPRLEFSRSCNFVRPRVLDVPNRNISKRPLNPQRCDRVILRAMDSKSCGRSTGCLAKYSFSHLFGCGAQEAKERRVKVKVLRVFLLQLLDSNVDNLCTQARQQIHKQGNKSKWHGNPTSATHVKRWWQQAVHRTGRTTATRKAPIITRLQQYHVLYAAYKAHVSLTLSTCAKRQVQEQYAHHFPAKIRVHGGLHGAPPRAAHSTFSTARRV